MRAMEPMHDRCYNPNQRAFAYYGARGIQVCCRWHRSNPDGFANFVADMGERPPNKSIDRVNNDFGYMPSNCRYATSRQQHENRRKPIPRWLLELRTVYGPNFGSKFLKSQESHSHQDLDSQAPELIRFEHSEG